MKPEINDILAYGIDFKNRRIYFGHPLDTFDLSSSDNAEITSASVELAIRAINQMAIDYPGRPIEIHMSSYGGSAYECLRLHDIILSCACQIKFFGSGVIMSAATWIMAVCDERYLYPNTTVMVHEGSIMDEGKHTDFQISAAEDKRLQNVLYDIYVANSRMPKDFWLDVCKHDLYLTAHETIALGLADKIVEPKKRGNLRKVRQSILRKQPDKKSMKKLIDDIYTRLNKVKIPKIEFNEIVKEPVDETVIIINDVEEAPKRLIALSDDSVPQSSS